ncbi:DUF6879 family protein [Thermobifida cellulosilytica]|uniref:DUF6879 domain-containing protein n=1 Tax=Thermobifida cellulosilytica TB100 TaxID=665004 RepID=A0A147KMA6_THECS|nr:DUF6879 family protein [Thermobifida cellulosilytica]KUP98368.1 hypothetical protein AC529_01915 [Thermobifida cellulosilytica TB100]
MRPPGWAVDRGKRLDLDAFASEFSRAWAQLGRRFLKVECWQSYRENVNSASQRAYEQGEYDRAVELLREEAEADRPLYEDVRSRGIEFARIRVLREPLTDYLRYELLAYRIRARMGETVEVVRAAPGVPLPSRDCFDFLLFDRDVALVHDYGEGPVGEQTGGWLVRAPDAVRELEARALELRAEAVPLSRFLTEAGL